ncbi:hypothetical protein N9795_00175 [Candidatus Pelagibacter sp.]|nr:hypothetical protein [Candidatus Pelagibacter sp.]
MSKLSLLKQLIKEELADFIRPKEAITFEDNPLEFIIQKYPSLDASLNDLLTADYRDYITGIYVIAPKPTTFKILLHNGQEFYMIYGSRAYTVKVSGKKYNLINLNEEEFAIKAVAQLLELGMPPGSEGPNDQMENETPAPNANAAPEGEAPAEGEPEEIKEGLREGKKFRIITEATDAEEGIDILKKNLNLTDENFIKVSANKYKLLVPRAERIEYIKKIQAIDGFDYDPSAKGSSIGALTYKNSSFLLKPTGAQGRASAGTENEDILENEINKYLDLGVKNIIFKGSNKSYTVPNATGVTGVGYDVAGGKKADIVITSTKGNYPISIKKDNAGFWESADTRYKALMTKLVSKIANGDFAPELVFKPFVDKLGNEKKGINIMYNDTTNTKVSGVLVTDLPNKEEESIIFGSDKAVVIYKTYTESDFTQQGDNLIIKVTKIIENMEDVIQYDLEPVLNIRHDSTRSATGGLRATVQPKNLLYKDGAVTGNKIELSYNDIV